LSTSTTPALTDNDVNGVTAGFSNQPAFDPRTGGPMPTFALTYGTGADGAALIKDNGTLINKADDVGNPGCAIWNGYILHADDNAGDHIVISQNRISEIISDDWANTNGNVIANNTAPYGLGCDVGFDMNENGVLAAADTNGLTLSKIEGIGTPLSGYTQIANSAIDRTYNTGYLVGDIRGAWLANSATTDRSHKANTLTETGTVTEAAVESGAELLGYSGFSSSNYFSRAYDADLDFGTGDFSVMGWFKLAASATYETLIDRGETSGNNQRWFLRVDNNGLMNAQIGDGTNNIYPGSSAGTVYDDDVWHQAILAFDGTAKTGTIYADGVQVATATDTNIGSLSNASAILRIGNLVNATTYPFNGTVALWRASATAPTAAQVRQMYDAEKGMFVASAECLLQSGSTDAVLDVDVDPLTGKVLVTQTDAITIFDGLAVDSKPTVNSGSSEKGKLWGDLRAEQNSANAYVTAPAVDQRQVNEMVRGLASELPKGVDLSKAKAWIKGTMPSTIHASYNVESISTVITGRVECVFGTPFKSSDYVVVGTSGTAFDRFFSSYETYQTAEHAHLDLYRHSTDLEQDGIFFAVFFGELENE
jgi:hypothetical protein